MNTSKLIAVTVVLAIVVIIVARANANSAAQSQDVRMLDRRVQLLEQRLYSIESTLNRLDQSSIRSSTSSSRDAQFDLMRQEIQDLSTRVTEAECALLKLDERTTPARPGSRRPIDPCRANPTQPLQFSSRP